MAIALGRGCGAVRPAPEWLFILKEFLSRFLWYSSAKNSHPPQDMGQGPLLLKRAKAVAERSS